MTALESTKAQLTCFEEDTKGGNDEAKNLYSVLQSDYLRDIQVEQIADEYESAFQEYMHSKTENQLKVTASRKQENKDLMYDGLEWVNVIVQVMNQKCMQFNQLTQNGSKPEHNIKFDSAILLTIDTFHSFHSLFELILKIVSKLNQLYSTSNLQE